MPELRWLEHTYDVTLMSGSSPISHNVVAGVVRITDLLIILLCGTLAHYLYLYQPDAQLGLTGQLGFHAYVVGIGAMLAAHIFHFADIYKFENLSRFFSGSAGSPRPGP